MAEHDEALVELVARAQYAAYWHVGPLPQSWTALPTKDRNYYRKGARAVLDALHDAGRLMPDGGGGQWGIGWHDQDWRNNLDNPDAVHVQDDPIAARAYLADAIADNCPGDLVRRFVGPWEKVPDA